MKTWQLEQELDVQVPMAQGDDDWEQDAWQNDDAPDWADDDDDWDEDEEEEEEEDEEEGDDEEEDQ